MHPLCRMAPATASRWAPAVRTAGRPRHMCVGQRVHPLAMVFAQQLDIGHWPPAQVEAVQQAAASSAGGAASGQLLKVPQEWLKAQLPLLCDQRFLTNTTDFLVRANPQYCAHGVIDVAASDQVPQLWHGPAVRAFLARHVACRHSMGCGPAHQARARCTAHACHLHCWQDRIISSYHHIFCCHLTSADIGLLSHQPIWVLVVGSSHQQQRLGMHSLRVLCCQQPSVECCNLPRCLNSRDRCAASHLAWRQRAAAARMQPGSPGRPPIHQARLLSGGPALSCPAGQTCICSESVTAMTPSAVLRGCVLAGQERGNQLPACAYVGQCGSDRVLEAGSHATDSVLLQNTQQLPLPQPCSMTPWTAHLPTALGFLAPGLLTCPPHLASWPLHCSPAHRARLPGPCTMHLPMLCVAAAPRPARLHVGPGTPSAPAAARHKCEALLAARGAATDRQLSPAPPSRRSCNG
jgi:hypothetical protein